jgi:hypothetical protein
MQQGSNGAADGGTATLTDEQILGLEPMGTATGNDAVPPAASSRETTHGDAAESLGSPDEQRREKPTYNRGESRDATASGNDEPAWLRALDAQPEAAAEARRWRQAALDTAALDADYFSAEPGTRAALAARLHADDPLAFRSMLADAARVLAERDPQGLAELARQLGVTEQAASASPAKSLARAARSASAEPPAPGPESPAGAFPVEAYRAFEASTNDDVARQVRDSIDRTLAATLPDGIADGARRRIGEDIFRDLNAALSTDRELAAQISDALRGWRFDSATQRQVAGLLAGRARTALPEVARRVVSEWTSSVLASDRARQSRIASAATRRDITGGRLPEPVASSTLRPRNLDYTRTSDEQILEM